MIWSSSEMGFLFRRTPRLITLPCCSGLNGVLLCPHPAPPTAPARRYVYNLVSRACGYYLIRQRMCWNEGFWAEDFSRIIWVCSKWGLKLDPHRDDGKGSRERGGHRPRDVGQKLEAARKEGVQPTFTLTWDFWLLKHKKTLHLLCVKPPSLWSFVTAALDNGQYRVALSSLTESELSLCATNTHVNSFVYDFRRVGSVLWASVLKPAN